jgi:hypothetical protein
LAASPKILACPLTSILNGPEGQRPFVAPGEPGGLRKPSEVQVDWVHAFVRTSIGPGIGHLDEATLRSVDEALRRWLDL